MIRLLEFWLLSTLMAGWIKIYTGPMFSREAEELIVELHRYMLA
ncbi:MAG: hypothetical protein ACP5UH_01615 [Candidatus Micrarchaeia archaeon]